MPPDPTERSVAFVLGTRPEIIKLGHLIRSFGPAARLIHTGQHFDVELSEIFFRSFGIEPPAEVLGVGGRSRGGQIGAAASALDSAFATDPPAVVVVQGDTNSTLAGALAANARAIPLVHVEAGLRSFDRAMPEEHNRVLTDHLSDVCLAPTRVSASNLDREGIDRERVVVTGNTVVEAVHALLPSAEARAGILGRYRLRANGYALSTFHRPENVDDPDTFAKILEELGALNCPVLLPLHPRSRGQMERNGLKAGAGVEVIDPIGYPEFLALLAESALAVGDSGGVQEEVSVLKRPMVVVRRSTERPEVLGTFATLIPPGGGIAAQANRWLGDLDNVLSRLADMETPYGDGSASERCSREIEALVARSAGASVSDSP